MEWYQVLAIIFGNILIAIPMCILIRRDRKIDMNNFRKKCDELRKK
jgi:hypothetical protein